MAPSSSEVRAATKGDAMETPLSIEERLSGLETRMTTLEQFREEMRAGHVMIVTELTERIEESQRYARTLHEDALARIAVIGEGLAVNVTGLKALEDKVDRMDARLSGAIDASRAETRAMFEQVFSRLDALTATRNRPRQSNKT